MEEKDLTKEHLKALMEEVKNLQGSVLMELTEDKIKAMQDVSANLPVYDNETMAKREFARGIAEGLRWFTTGVERFIDDSNALLQKRKK